MIDIGISHTDRKQITQELTKLLSDTYSAYLMAHNFHWNVTGPLFQSLHQIFEEEYTEMALAVDQIAERIRALGEKVPASFKAFSHYSSIDIPDTFLEADEMIKTMVKAHESIVRTARHAMSVATNANDEPTADLLTDRMMVHEKAAWMLRSMAE